jgi:ABC-type polysaccharide/polyol phosphate transport system ATPase subunit
MSEYAIEVENLRISYKGLKSYSIKKNLLLGKWSKHTTFEALKGISFRLQKGEILGIVGKNGSGKSTLLKAIGGIFTPDSGSVDLHGNTVSLLAIGVGFQKELSGRDNILLSGMLLGFTKEEILDKMEEIIAFSELGEFVDKPVRTYSSGMYSKLSFAVTAILETDIILIDEVLSVGDSRFKRKSYAKMKELISKKNRTVIIVSHDRKAITDLCDKVLWINDGQLKQFGETAEVLKAYDAFMK